WTDRNGVWCRFTYDEAGRTVRTAGTDGIYNDTFTYDDAARTTTYTDSHGHSTVFRYNEDGQVVAETDPLGNTTHTEWDTRGHDRLSHTDELGRTTRYSYDEAGNLAEILLPDGSRMSATYNTLRQPTEVTEPGGACWLHTYDEQGNLTRSVDPAGAVSHYAYDERGHLTAITDALGHTRRITPTPAGLPATVTDALGHTTRISRDTFGRITEITDPLGHVTRMAWTVEGKPRWREDAEGARESWTWDAESNLLTHTDPAGNSSSHTPGPWDMPVSRTDADGATYTFTYDTTLRLTRVTNPQGLHWEYEYDPAGRLTSETDFNGARLAYALDPAGQLTARTNAVGQTLRYTRDALGRVTEQHDEDADTVTTYTYNATGDLVRASSPGAEVVIERDPLGRVLTETTNDRTLSYTYNPLGLPVQRTTSSGLTSTWTYDADGRAVELATDHGTLTFTYDAAGRETERRTGDISLIQQWDAADRLTTQTASSGPELLQHRTYAYRADGYLTEISELTSGTRRFDLDSVGRVTAVNAHGWRESYVYDSAGNLSTTQAPDHPAPGERGTQGTLLRRAGRTAYEHDAAGRLISKTRYLLNGQKKTWTYTWNAEDRLIEAATPDDGQWTYAYDPLGRRVSKTGRNGRALTFTWDGTRLAEQTTSDGQTTSWDYAPATHRLLTQTDHTPLTRGPDGGSLLTKLAKPTVGNPRFYAVLTDLTGAPTDLVSPDGKVAWQHRTTLWGTPLPSPPSDTSPICPLRFPGQYADPETGLNYNYFRYYDPETAHYLTPDPLGLAPAPNPHTYVHNPHTWTDPLGLAGCGQTKLSRGEKVAAAEGVDDLSPEVRKSLTNFMRKSPGAAEVPQIIRLPEGAAEFSYKVPGRVPGSYAVYRKRVDAEGATEMAYKTTFLPDGSIAHIKFK
ncbi:RHS repeat-associated core domain-containing protein, partial [Streptomyces sp. NPDC007063]